MKDSPISPIDERYYSEARPLARFFSEEALVMERAEVELDYLRFLVKAGVAPRRKVPTLEVSYEEVKRLEASMGHDVKALEVHLREGLSRSNANDLARFVHLGMTSEDLNNLAYGRLVTKALRSVMIPEYESLAKSLAEIAYLEAESVMLARTHGRPALPTTFGKEIANFAVRIAERTNRLKAERLWGKVSGAVGTYASFKLFEGSKDWPQLLRRFVESMGLDYVKYTTQIIPNERYSDLFHYVIDINQLMLGLARDLWTYQAVDYLRFARRGKVSSSTMPQKENPVDLENAEGQVEISNSILSLLAYRLEVSRLQRDLSDSVIKRMMGQALAHSLVACKRLASSLRAMVVDRRIMRDDLLRHPEVYAEAIQLLLRIDGNEQGYEEVKKSVESGTFSIPRKYSKRIGSYLGLAPELGRLARAEVASLLSD